MVSNQWKPVILKYDEMTECRMVRSMTQYDVFLSWTKLGDLAARNYWDYQGVCTFKSGDSWDIQLLQKPNGRMAKNARSWARTGTIWHILTPEQWNMNEVTTVHVDWLVIIRYYRGYTLIHGFTPWFIDVYCMSLWPNWEPWLEPTSGLVNYAGMMIIGLRDLVLFSSLPQWHKHIYTISTPGWVKTIPNGS